MLLYRHGILKKKVCKTVQYRLIWQSSAFSEIFKHILQGHDSIGIVCAKKKKESNTACLRVHLPKAVIRLDLELKSVIYHFRSLASWTAEISSVKSFTDAL